MMPRPVWMLAGMALLANPAWAQQAPTAPDTPAVPLMAPGTPPVALPPAASPLPPTNVAPAPVPTLPPMAATAGDAPLKGAAAPALPAVPATPEAPPAPTPDMAPVLAAPAGEPPYSYGNIPYSLMFTTDQITNMKNALKAYEQLLRRKVPQGEQILIEEFTVPTDDVAPPAPEPTTYPTFTLSSIVYNSSSNWMVWLGGARITPSTNDRDVRVVAVSREKVDFSWKPGYVDDLIRRAQAERFADTAKIRNKLADPNTATVDAQAREVRFSLKPNQTFAPGYMAIFEGRVGSPTLESITGEGAPMVAPAAPTTPGGGMAQGAIERMYQQQGGQKLLPAPTAPGQPIPAAPGGTSGPSANAPAAPTQP